MKNYTEEKNPMEQIQLITVKKLPCGKHEIYIPWSLICKNGYSYFFEYAVAELCNKAIGAAFCEINGTLPKDQFYSLNMNSLRVTVRALNMDGKGVSIQKYPDANFRGTNGMMAEQNGVWCYFAEKGGLSMLVSGESYVKEGVPMPSVEIREYIITWYSLFDNPTERGCVGIRDRGYFF